MSETVIVVAFWFCTACVAYTYAGYPLLLAAWAKLRPRPVRRAAAVPCSVSFVVCAHNEGDRVGPRLDELTKLLDVAGVAGEIILVSDGSTDDTGDIARSFADRGVTVVKLPDKVGKAAALTAGCERALGDVLVFADVRQTWAPDALGRLLENFADAEVGAVSGDLVLENSDGVLGGVRGYWGFEKWLRRQESRVWSIVGATGAISAVRRELFMWIPAGTVLDDVYWPLQVALAGRRVVMEPQAHAFDRLPTCAADEFRRKVRTQAGNFQLMTLLPAALLPWRNPIWLQLVSHKLMRLLVPWALLALVPLSLLSDGTLFRAALSLQVVGYVLGALGLLFRETTRRFKLVSAAASFLILNGASWAAFWVWASGRTRRSWCKALYDEPRRPTIGAVTSRPRVQPMTCEPR
jgi:cellulose synthase/poly-beta-1,6-N-acetylglucosamine synthase-like glycosyltransferase